MPLRTQDIASPMNGNFVPRNDKPLTNGFRANFTPSPRAALDTYANETNDVHANSTPSPKFGHHNVYNNQQSKFTGSSSGQQSTPLPAARPSRASFAVDAGVIEKDNVLVYRCSLEEMIVWVCKNLDSLFEDVLNYGDSNILSLEKIKEFIDRKELTDQINVQQFSYLCTFFTNWTTKKGDNLFYLFNFNIF
jgi:hypothetical protein